MIKQKLKKILSLVLVFAITFPIVSTALSNFAFAAVIKDVYTVVYPRWNDSNQNGWGHPELTLLNGWEIPASSNMLLRAMGSYYDNICYCIEPGVPEHSGNSLEQKGEDFWEYYPPDYNDTLTPFDIKAYTVGEVRYRKAIAHGERYAANYVAVYEDVVALPDVDGYNAVAEYRSEIPELTGETEYTVQATATYTPPVVQETVVEQQETVVEGEPKTVVEEKVVEKPVPVQTPVPLFNGDSSGNNSTTTEIVAIVSTVFAGLLLIVLLAIAILYILSRKRKKKGEERH